MIPSGNFLDITEPDEIEIIISYNGKVVWINQDGICVLRVCRIKSLVVYDERTPAGAVLVSERENSPATHPPSPNSERPDVDSGDK